jgi:hypothetical protein
MPRSFQKDPTALRHDACGDAGMAARLGAAEPALCRSGALLEHRGEEEAMKLVLILAGLIGLYALLLRTGNPTAALVLTTAAEVIAAVIAGLMREASDF